MKEIYLDLEKDSLDDAVKNFTGIAHIIKGAPNNDWPYDGDIIYYADGLVHREDGPAIMSHGREGYLLNDLVYDRLEYWQEAYRLYKDTDKAPKIMANILGATNEV